MSVEDEIKQLQEKRVFNTSRFSKKTNKMCISNIISNILFQQAKGENDEVEEGDRISLMSKGTFDSDIYGGSAGGGFSGVVQEVGMEDDEEEPNHPSTRASINADKKVLEQGTDADSGVDPFATYREEVCFCVFFIFFTFL